jgi:osmotically-inducible protein OsmY
MDTAATHIWTRTTRWAVAALVGAAMATIGCAPGRDMQQVRPRPPVVADSSLVNAFDTSVEMRVVDRIELDRFLRDRDIRVRVIDGVVTITGYVWTPLEKQRVGTLVRSVAGAIDVANELAVTAPR